MKITSPKQIRKRESIVYFGLYQGHIQALIINYKRPKSYSELKVGLDKFRQVLGLLNPANAQTKNYSEKHHIVY